VGKSKAVFFLLPVRDIPYLMRLELERTWRLHRLASFACFDSLKDIAVNFGGLEESCLGMRVG
jgi:hypothetical protein